MFRQNIIFDPMGYRHGKFHYFLGDFHLVKIADQQFSDGLSLQLPLSTSPRGHIAAKHPSMAENPMSDGAHNDVNR